MKHATPDEGTTVWLKSHEGYSVTLWANPERRRSPDPHFRIPAELTG
jgi:hypothetical protein